ncbi:hypothetical protein BDV25DRAFT_141171 [Aspergillus avenaceus]|uniref:Uncharacterized protein n=1 Tax=Aspergillus avenaceus TaxID=36643 RepID=A0A5N6TRT2_ASPAV|nr:hypothetical protein BDV25DRAFT_141171 [Aspergillus avenaceus]
MRQELSDFPSRYTYNGKIINGLWASTQSMVIPPAFLNALKQWIQSMYPKANLDRIDWYAPGFNVKRNFNREFKNMSRYNARHAKRPLLLVLHTPGTMQAGPASNV